MEKIYAPRIESKKWNSWKREMPYRRSLNYDEDGSRPKFTMWDTNLYLDIHTKRAALRVSPSVVSLLSYSGDKSLYQCSGTIIESDDSNCGIVLTSANLIRPCSDNDGNGQNVVANHLKVIVILQDGKSFEGQVIAYDFHYNLIVVCFKADGPLQIATLRPISDCFDLNTSQLRLAPGDDVIAVGRYFGDSFSLMAAPGEYCLDPCDYDCKELFMTTCLMTRCGDGSPLINFSGEVIGIAFYDLGSTPFLPINFAYKWWHHYKIHGVPRRPSLGIQAIAFSSASFYIVNKVIEKFPSISKGVVVEKVIPGSSAESAGLKLYDVIIQCGGKVVQSFIEFFEIVWDKVGHSVDLLVVRASYVSPLTLKLMVVEPESDELNRWLLWN
ncbi:unnamed protein product [Amaranthus hypochondriacus]